MPRAYTDSIEDLVALDLYLSECMDWIVALRCKYDIV